MAEAQKAHQTAHTVRLEPVGVEFEVEHGETVLDAAFRQGIALPHGCKEGQCSACKCVLVDGEVDKGREKERSRRNWRERKLEEERQ